jgi:hypothetical protein
MVSIECSWCHGIFERSERLARRPSKTSYCSRRCVGLARNSQGTLGWVRQPASKFLVDEFSPYRRFLRGIQRRDPNSSITLQTLKEIYENQKGICPYTKIQMILPVNSGKSVKNPQAASLDRIDSKLGYAVDNIEFVCLSVNYAKNIWSRDQMMKFYAVIVQLDRTRPCEG